MPANLENAAVATGLEKVSFHSNPKKGNAKECSNYCTIALISHTSKEGGYGGSKLSSGHRTGKGQFSFQFQKKAMPKNAQTTTQLHSSHMLVK